MEQFKKWISLHWGYIFYVAIFLFYSIAVYQCGKRNASQVEDGEVKTTTKIVPSTDKLPKVISTKPLYLFSYITKHKVSRDTITPRDTVTRYDTIPIPITQKTYKGTNYTAYVSGFHQSLDSIEVRERVITNTIVKKRSRWNVGISAGYGINKNGLTPFIGIGVTYNLFK